MNPIILSRIQFAFITIYHFFFVPLTLGLSVYVAIMETIYVRTGNEVYKRMAKFWGNLFLINFAMGVVTGIVQEFQFGMNWSEYSRFVGDIFGAPLAIEALLAFFLESTFLGIWIFGWDRLSKGLHATAIWLVAIGSTLSAFWILIANSFMQHPVGFRIENGRAVMDNFFALLTNPYFWPQFLHTICAGFSTASFFILGISAYHLYKNKDEKAFQRSFQMAAIIGLIAIIPQGLIGHYQAQQLMELNPMKMVASEALWESEEPASFSVFTFADQDAKRNIIDIRLPLALSILVYNRASGEVPGINQLQDNCEQEYGYGNYIPPINITNYTFRIMVMIGFFMLGFTLYSLYQMVRKKPIHKMLLFRFFPIVLVLPYLANSSGWILTEMGRQPWIVFGLLKTVEGITPIRTVGSLMITLVGFAIVYCSLLIADVFLLYKSAKAGITQENQPDNLQDAY